MPAEESSAWSVDVEFVVDHDSLKAGRVIDDWHRVVVLARDGDEATLIAEQMVACHAQPTRTMIRI